MFGESVPFISSKSRSAAKKCFPVLDLVVRNLYGGVSDFAERKYIG